MRLISRWITSFVVILLIFLQYCSIGVSGNQGDAEDQIDLWSSNKISPDNTPPLNDGRKRNGERKKKKRPNGISKKEKKEGRELAAMRKWAESLTPNDYNLTYWHEKFNTKSASDIFNGYAAEISRLWKKAGAKVNFALVGACDGLGDKTIKKLYLPNDHWRGVFVEPISINVRDIITFMAKHNAAHRSLIIRAAATSHCENPTIKMERPLYEEKNASIPHWLRRQIGSVLPEHRDHARNEWIIEEVRCITGPEILHDWAVMGTALASSADPLIKKRIRRPHILKIDVEGHDYHVLTGFFRPDTPPHELPLIVEFEAKSIGKKYPEAKARMEDLGYIVTPFGQDGFAILRADVILDSINPLAIPPEVEPDV